MTNKDSSTEPNLRLGGNSDVASALSSQVGNLGELEAQMDELIMRLKDCISHENQPRFTDRCITKIQFKQQMKALLAAAITAALGEIEVPRKRDMAAMQGLGMSGNECFNEAIDLVSTSIEEVKGRYGGSK